jgi:hypothetical protein
MMSAVTTAKIPRTTMIDTIYDSAAIFLICRIFSILVSPEVIAHLGFVFVNNV